MSEFLHVLNTFLHPSTPNQRLGETMIFLSAAAMLIWAVGEIIRVLIQRHRELEEAHEGATIRWSPTAEVRKVSIEAANDPDAPRLLTRAEAEARALEERIAAEAAEAARDKTFDAFDKAVAETMARLDQIRSLLLKHCAEDDTGTINHRELMRLLAGAPPTDEEIAAFIEVAREEMSSNA